MSFSVPLNPNKKRQIFLAEWTGEPFGMLKTVSAISQTLRCFWVNGLMVYEKLKNFRTLFPASTPSINS